MSPLQNIFKHLFQWETEEQNIQERYEKAQAADFASIAKA